MNEYNYKEDFYKAQKTGSYISAKKILPLIFEKLHIRSVVDFGCGTGAWLKMAKSLGAKKIIGLDFGEIGEHLCIYPEEFMSYDLTEKIDLKYKFDLVISLEVAEHLPSSCAKDFIDNLCRHGDVVLFSAAIPGQVWTKTAGHINEQFLSYWVQIFSENGYQIVDAIRNRIWNDEEIEFWYRQNTVLFVSKERRDLLMLFSGNNSLIDCVHYKLYEKYLLKSNQILNLLSIPFEKISRKDVNFVLYGYEETSKIVCSRITLGGGVNVRCFIDRRPKAKEYEGVPVLSVDEYDAQDRDVIIVFPTFAFWEIKEELKKLSSKLTIIKAEEMHNILY